VVSVRRAVAGARVTLLAVVTSAALAACRVEKKVVPAAEARASVPSPTSSAAPPPQSSPAPRSTPTATRVVLVTLDTVRCDALGVYGSSRPLTPHLDALAKRGVQFTRAGAPMPETVPSHVSMFTGRVPLAHGVTTNYLQPSDDTVMAAELLSSAKVATAAFFHVVPFDRMNVTQGFATVKHDATVHAEHMTANFFAWWDALPPDQPAFAWLHYYLAHEPEAPSAELAKKFVEHPYRGPLDFGEATRMKLMTSRAPVPPEYALALKERYDAQVAADDARFGEIVAGLEQRGALEKVLFVVAADHGEGFENGQLGTHALVSRQSTLHVPLIVAGPKASGGKTVDEVVQLVDLFPTILESFGVAPAAGAAELDGRSLWPLVEGKAQDWDDAAFATLPTSVVPGAEKELPKTLTLWTGRWKLVVKNPGAGATAMLRDLEKDPDENQDCAKEHPEMVRAMLQRLDQWVARARNGAKSAQPVPDDVARQLQQLGYGR
jgi:arylsulfatase A-like enzyme